MKTLSRPRCSPDRGFTLIELLVVVTAVLLSMAVGFARLQEARRSSARNPLQCQQNLHQISMALFDFAEAHADRLPWEVSVKEGGSQEAIVTGQATPHFRALTNSIRNARVLLCPMDPIRHRGTTIATFDDAAISYFVNVSSRLTQKNAILAGDRTLSLTDDPSTGALAIQSNSPLQWVNPTTEQSGHQTLDTHETTGNLLFANGSLMETRSVQLQRLLRSLGKEEQQLILP